jgi:hypothetical protein
MTWHGKPDGPCLVAGAPSESGHVSVLNHPSELVVQRRDHAAGERMLLIALPTDIIKVDALLTRREAVDEARQVASSCQLQQRFQRPYGVEVAIGWHAFPAFNPVGPRAVQFISVSSSAIRSNRSTSVSGCRAAAAPLPEASAGRWRIKVGSRIEPIICARSKVGCRHRPPAVCTQTGR